MRKVIFFILFSLARIGFMNAQVASFFNTYPQFGDDKAYALSLTSDGGYIIVGSTWSFGHASSIYLIKTNALGDTMWTNFYDTPFFDQGFDVQETYDGGYIVAGQLGEPDTLGGLLSKIHIFKTNDLGDTTWTFTWDAGAGDRAHSIQHTMDSNYIVTGVINGGLNNLGNPRAFLLKLNSYGDTLWSKTYEDNSYGETVIPTLEGGFMVCGQYGNKTYLVKTNAMGDVIWTKKGNLGFEHGRGEGVIQLSDSSFMVTGSVYTGFGQNLFISRIDKDGNLLWSKQYGGSEDDYATSIDYANNGAIISGSTYSYALGQFTNDDIWLLRVDENGDTLWTRSYGNTDYDIGFDVHSCPDGGFAVTGFRGVTPDVFLLKTDSLGHAPFLTSISKLPDIKESEVKIFPNPTTDLLTIKFDYFTPQNSQIQIFDVVGKMVHHQVMTEQTHQISLGDLANGVYIVRVQAGDKVYTRKVVKQ